MVSFRLVKWCALSLALNSAIVGLAQAQVKASPLPSTLSAQTLDTVQVTVKTSETVRDVPHALTVLSAEQLEERKINSLQRLAGWVPNMTSSQAGGVNTLTLRGIGGGGRNIGFDPRVGVYLDGVYVGQSASLVQSLFDLEQVVVLKGPQGYQFGRNSVAGAVVLNTPNPSEEWENKLKLRLGNYDLREIQVQSSGPLSDRWSFQGGIQKEDRDGTINNGPNSSRLDNRNRGAVRAKLRFEQDERTTWTLSLDGSRTREHNIVGEPVAGFFGLPIPNSTPYTTDFNTLPKVDMKQSGVALTYEHQDQSNRTWTTILAGRNLKQDRVNDTDYSRADLVTINYVDQFTSASLESRVASDRNLPFRYTVGTYALNEESQSRRDADFGQDVLTTFITPPGSATAVPVGALYNFKTGPGVLSSGRVHTQSLALFGSAEWDFAPEWTAAVGIRAQVEKKDMTYHLNGVRSGRLNIATTTTPIEDERKKTQISPMASVSWEISPLTKSYLTYSEGYKSGGWNLDFLTSAQVASGLSFDDEKVKNWELGIRGRSSDKTLSYDVALFHSSIQDYQVFQSMPLPTGGSFFQLTNAAQATSRGIEAQIQWRPASVWGVNAFAAFQDAQFDRFPDGGGPGVDLAGYSLPEAPRWNAGVSSRWDWSSHSGAWWSLQVDYQFRSTSYIASTNRLTEKLPSRHQTNVRAEYQPTSGKWSLGLWVDNLTNEEVPLYRNADFFGHQVIKYQDPRTYGLDWTLNF